MPREPSYPEDAPVDRPAGSDNGDAGTDEGRPAGSGRTKHLVTGAAIGIGSAALVAALLYANRARKGGEGER